jgi:hypothetical protein
MPTTKKIILISITFLTSFNIFCQDSTWTKYVDQVGITPGIWVPEKNKAIGPQFLVGFSAGFKKKIHSLIVYGDFIGVGTKTKDTLKISDNNVTVNGRRISGQQFTISYGLDVLRKNKFTTRLEAGIGHTAFLINPKDEKLRIKYNSLVPGINFKFDLPKNNSLGLSVQYYFTSYTPSNKYPEVRGNYLSARIIFSFR